MIAVNSHFAIESGAIEPMLYGFCFRSMIPKLLRRV
jgi:hypothetical protein